MTEKDIKGWLCCGVVLSPILLLLPATIWMAINLLRRSAGRKREGGAGHCPSCGYDLRASPDRCPECGAAVSPP